MLRALHLLAHGRIPGMYGYISKLSWNDELPCLGTHILVSYSRRLWGRTGRHIADMSIKSYIYIELENYFQKTLKAK